VLPMFPSFLASSLFCMLSVSILLNKLLIAFYELANLAFNFPFFLIRLFSVLRMAHMTIIVQF
jgi:hypothetical protein